MKTEYDRRCFASQLAAEQFLINSGYTKPAIKTDCWNSPNGLIDAYVRYNECGYFVTYRA